MGCSNIIMLVGLGEMFLPVSVIRVFLGLQASESLCYKIFPFFLCWRWNIDVVTFVFADWFLIFLNFNS